jgi:hypothetical protein
MVLLNLLKKQDIIGCRFDSYDPGQKQMADVHMQGNESSGSTWKYLD